MTTLLPSSSTLPPCSLWRTRLLRKVPCSLKELISWCTNSCNSRFILHTSGHAPPLSPRSSQPGTGPGVLHQTFRIGQNDLRVLVLLGLHFHAYYGPFPVGYGLFKEAVPPQHLEQCRHLLEVMFPTCDPKTGVLIAVDGAGPIAKQAIGQMHVHVETLCQGDGLLSDLAQLGQVRLVDGQPHVAATLMYLSEHRHSLRRWPQQAISMHVAIRRLER